MLCCEVGRTVVCATPELERRAEEEAAILKLAVAAVDGLGSLREDEGRAVRSSCEKDGSLGSAGPDARCCWDDGTG